MSWKKQTWQFLNNSGVQQCSIFILSWCLPYHMQILNPRSYDSILENKRLPAVFLFCDFSEIYKFWSSVTRVEQRCIMNWTNLCIKLIQSFFIRNGYFFNILSFISVYYFLRYLQFTAKISYILNSARKYIENASYHIKRPCLTT